MDLSKCLQFCRKKNFFLQLIRNRKIEYKSLGLCETEDFADNKIRNL